MILDNRGVVRKVLLITLILNIFVVSLKLFVGLKIGSLSLKADALHSITDGANNILGLIANRFSSPQPDRDHPYGHQKFQAVGALGIAGFLAIACLEIVRGAIERIWEGGKPIEVSGIELWILLLVLGINIFVTFYERREGKRVKSSILIADAYHTMSDVWITITVMGGLVGIWVGNIWNLPQLQWLDVILAFPVAFLVFQSGKEVIKENLPWLVDEVAVPPEEIYNLVMEVPGVINCHDIASRGVLGRQMFIEMHLVVSAKDVENAHKITEQVELRLEEKFSPVRVIIHVEPPNYRSNRISFGT